MADKTGAEAGLGAGEQTRIALQAMVAGGGVAQMADIYAAVEAEMAPDTLSAQGRATLRTYVNRDAVKAGFVAQYDKEHPGWHITADGREYLAVESGADADDEEEVTDELGHEVKVSSNQVLALGFEKYVLDMMRRTYPEYAWYHQGVHKKHERGIDLLATRLRPDRTQPDVIGVQVKLHAERNAPSEKEWLKFMAGCFARGVARGIFVTTGRLTGGQRREAGEARLVIIEGYEELSRLAAQVGLPAFNEPATSDEPDT